MQFTTCGIKIRPSCITRKAGRLINSPLASMRVWSGRNAVLSRPGDVGDACRGHTRLRIVPTTASLAGDTSAAAADQIGSFTQVAQGAPGLGVHSLAVFVSLATSVELPRASWRALALAVAFDWTRVRRRCGRVEPVSSGARRRAGLLHACRWSRVGVAGCWRDRHVAEKVP